MKQAYRFTMFLLFCSFWANAQKDCCTAFDLIGGGAPNVMLTTAGSGKPDEVSCSCLSAEGGSWWYKFSATTSGTFEMIVEPINQPAPNFDFALWIDNCPCNNGSPLPPVNAVSCNNVAGTGPTGITDKPDAVFGYPPSTQFSPTLNLIAGKNYFLLVSNVDDTGAGFSLRTAGTATIGPIIIDDFGLTIAGPPTVCNGGEAVFTATSQPSPVPTYYGWEILQTGYQIATGEEPQVALDFPALALMMFA